jgi:hypothetical protein
LRRKIIFHQRKLVFHQRRDTFHQRKFILFRRKWTFHQRKTVFHQRKRDLRRDLALNPETKPLCFNAKSLCVGVFSERDAIERIVFQLSEICSKYSVSLFGLGTKEIPIGALKLQSGFLLSPHLHRKLAISAV